MNFKYVSSACLILIVKLSFSLGLYNYLFTLFKQVLAPLLHLGDKKSKETDGKDACCLRHIIYNFNNL